MPTMKRLVGIVILGLLAWTGYEKYQARSAASAPAIEASAASPAHLPTEVTSQFKCDGRTHCSQMTSCAEATYFLRNCPGTQMDGNNDGIPCERQWCR
jgi:hypothetical protein